MSDKSLKDKAIRIQGKRYVLVSDRIAFFNAVYPEGYIQTHLISAPEADMVIVRAQVTPNKADPHRHFTGYSQAKWGEGYINKTSALENCETSAVGRALAMMGIGVIDSVASVDEIRKAKTSPPVKPKRPKYNVLDDSMVYNDNGLCGSCHAPKGKPHAKGCIYGE